MCYASELVSGVNRVSDNGSYEPRISREYSDEKFVFGQIPIEDIQFISIPRHLINTDIRELQYLYCNSQYELVENNVNNFLNEIEVYCDIKIPRNKFESILEKFEEEQLRYNNYSRAEANEKSNEYFAKIDSMKELLNSYIQEWMNIGFSEILGKTYDEKITLGEVMQYILNANGIQYDIVDEQIVNDNEGPFVDFQHLI